MAERIERAEDLWDSVAAKDSGAATLSDAQLEAIQERLDVHDADPSSAVPWEKIRAELFSRAAPGCVLAPPASARAGCVATSASTTA